MKEAIQIRNLGKEYQLGSGKSGSLRETLSQLASGEREETSSFWALKGLSAVIAEGEAVGIIGRNGAGKSTLLKVLSRITHPSEGSFKIKGRLASLLEVGTGFHPELTGRENIFLNGTILGMRRAEVRAKFDQIVDFSGVEKFLDTPVKRYSSGMYVRLAFSVAAHLEPEVLIIDEVLAVGDAEFQKKCLGKMGEVSSSGRTVIFVSHNMSAVRNLCSRVLYLKDGQLLRSGSPEETIHEYLHGESIASGRSFNLSKANRPSREGALLRFQRMEVNKENFMVDDPFEAKIYLEEIAYAPIQNLVLGLRLINPEDQDIYQLSSLFLDERKLPYTSGSVYRFFLPMLRVVPGRYKVVLFLSADGDFQDMIHDEVFVNVIGGSAYPNQAGRPYKGLVMPDYQFEVISE